MTFTDYINSHHVFTTADLMFAADSPGSAEEQLRLAVKSGTVERVRRGLLVSNHGRFEGASLDPAQLVTTLDPTAVLSYHSALEAWGVAHDVSFACQFRSGSVKSGFTFRGISYEPYGRAGDVRVTTIRACWGRKRVTTREQTVLDSLDRSSLVGGVEEAVRSITAFAWLDVDELLELSMGEGPSAASRVGWLLEQKKNTWHVDEKTLNSLENVLGSGPYHLGRIPVTAGWSARWKLILPDSNEEVVSWITNT